MRRYPLFDTADMHGGLQTRGNRWVPFFACTAVLLADQPEFRLIKHFSHHSAYLLFFMLAGVGIDGG